MAFMDTFLEKTLKYFTQIIEDEIAANGHSV